MMFFGGEEGALGMEFGCRRYLNCRWVWASNRNVLLGTTQSRGRVSQHQRDRAHDAPMQPETAQKWPGLLLGYRDLSTRWILAELHGAQSLDA